MDYVLLVENYQFNTADNAIALKETIILLYTTLSLATARPKGFTPCVEGIQLLPLHFLIALLPARYSPGG